MSSTTEPTFHLGITMAGAVSAGAYTAGFMDYVLEALNEWEKAKEKNRNAVQGQFDKRIPMYNVQIDAIGGASAGGMVSMITALMFHYKEMKPVREVSYTKTGNILYDSWVFLDDDMTEKDRNKRKTTFRKMLEIDDLKGQKGAPSLLNSKPIDTIAERVFNNLPSDAGPHNFPKYVSKDLHVLLTVTSLQPLAYTVNFSRIKSKFMDTTPGHRIGNHDIVAHFKIAYDPSKDKDEYLPFSPNDNDSRALLIKTTKATGAFPIGLAPRHFEHEFSSKYVQSNLSKRKAFSSDTDIRFDDDGDTFRFTGVDGGAINNEPFDEVIRQLIANHEGYDPKEPKFGTIMIDPFPNFEEPANGDQEPLRSGLLSSLGKLIPTILDQARNKRNDSYGNGLFKLLAFPIKWESPGKLKPHPPLATGGIGGFGGFLDLDFRIHDFFLGRDNARNFLRAFNFLEYDKAAPIYLFKKVDPEAVEAFSRTITDKITGEQKVYMPIIPDISRLTGDTNPYYYTVDSFPKLDRERFKTLKKPLRKRIRAVITAELNERVDSWFLRGIIGTLKGLLVRKLTNWVMETIENDFARRQM
ncbi:hypothetical protein FK220_011210 [Flavobacteriaceae bacterium TP-CH-4]|uniref:PNPLA domain-containing protein n=1 Tax=Pelagihabitans pacificus TaxID=2696054 RepID=A0A967E5Y2_9FLAO|nr:patatin-like phospholipase family protein [Pelagihabitans pacificus]NHF59912.1 hypothetical protein [Pelagihabitans pacificus]